MSLKSTRIACLLLVWATAAYAKPNVVFVLTDDQGYGDLSCHGNPILNNHYYCQDMLLHSIVTILITLQPKKR